MQDRGPSQLQAASLLSTAWVNRSQYHLFSTVEFAGSRMIKKWYSRIKPDPYGVSRHVRVLTVGWRERPATLTSPLIASDIKTAIHHLTSFENLREFILGYTWLKDASPGVLFPIFFSSADTLKRLRWINHHADIHGDWEDIRTLADLLPDLTYVDPPDYLYEDEGSRVRFSADEERTPAIKRFTFHELQITDVTLLSLPFFEPRGPHLQVLDLQQFEICDHSKG